MRFHIASVFISATVRATPSRAEASKPNCTDAEWVAYPLQGDSKAARRVAFQKQKRISADALFQLLRIDVALFMSRGFLETR